MSVSRPLIARKPDFRLANSVVAEVPNPDFQETPQPAKFDVVFAPLALEAFAPGKTTTQHGGAPIRVLMSEGSSLSARESLVGLGRAGFHVEVVDANPLCLARFSKFCRRLHRAPHFGLDPKGYLDRIIGLLTKGRFDVLFPAHEQAYLFARFLDRLSVLTHLALPDFEIFERLQSKVGFAGVLEELGLPSPPTVIAKDEHSLRAAASVLPVYVKVAFGTATKGLFRVRSAEELALVVEGVRTRLADGVVVQGVVEGSLERMQAVFDRGRIVGFHANRQAEEGVSGRDLVKESVRATTARTHMERIGRHLTWHGGLSIDYIVDTDGEPKYIDSNPRLAETGNALAAGLNLPELLVQVSLGQHPPVHDVGAPGIRSFMGIQGLLRAARDGGRRRDVVRAVIEIAGRRGVFAQGTEELTPAANDGRSLIPLIAVGSALLAKPSLWKRLSSATVNAYAATPEVVRFVHTRS
jgi:predicted ATP-grasp superfamily ATP-dependent carboligase